MSEHRPTALALLAIGLSGPIVVTACSDRTLATDAADDTGEPSRPPAGAMFSECLAHEDCAPLPYCVFPEGEAGFCTRPCSNGMPDGCDPPGAGTAALTCIEVGSGQPVCALDCDSATCPFDMTCEAVDTLAGERRICF